MSKAMRGKLAKLEQQQAHADYVPPTFCLPVSDWHLAGEELAPGCFASTYYKRASVAYTDYELLQRYTESRPGSKFFTYRITDK